MRCFNYMSGRRFSLQKFLAVVTYAFVGSFIRICVIAIHIPRLLGARQTHRKRTAHTAHIRWDLSLQHTAQSKVYTCGLRPKTGILGELLKAASSRTQSHCANPKTYTLGVARVARLCHTNTHIRHRLAISCDIITSIYRRNSGGFAHEHHATAPPFY